MEQRTDSKNDRRHFLKTSATALAAAQLMGTRAWAGANEKVRVAVVGVHGQGRSHVRQYLAIKEAELVALCDVDESVLDKASEELIVGKGFPKPKFFWNYQELLEDPSIDAVSFATPNHWHSLQAIWGCQAGKHVYVEKPLSHNIWEGRQLVKAARKYNRIVQHGTNSRSSKGVQEAVRLLREGVIGEVYMAKGLCYKWRDTINHTPDEPVPQGVHYDQWMGPAPERPFSRNRFHYNWHWQWPYGNGDIGNQGIHQMDVTRWGLGVKLPSKVQAMGRHFMFEDDQTTPNVLLASMEYPEEKKMLVFEVRHWVTNHEGEIGEGSSNTTGNLFFGSEGYMVIEGGSYRTYLGKERKPGPSGNGGGDNWQNFIDAILSGDPQTQNVDVEDGHLSCALFHLANIAYRVGRTIEVDIENETVKNDTEAQRLVNDGDRGYREPYVVPKEV